MLAHGFYLKPGGDVFRSTPTPQDSRSINGAKIAQQLGSPVSANLVLLGFAAASGSLFCNAGQVEETLKRLGGKRLDASLKAFQAGRDAG
jgi:indolepyruvate ferredoxin oxidoreductase beta subunit